MKSMEFKGMRIKDALQKVIERSTNAVFVAEGDMFRGEVKLCPNSDKAKFIYVRDDFCIGKSSPDLLSDEFVALRAEGEPFPLNPPSAVERYKERCLPALIELQECKNAQIYLLQWDDYISQIWQLAMQAVIEQNGLSNRVTRLRIDDSFLMSDCDDDILIDGSYEAYCEIICRHRNMSAEKFLIDPAAVECYLDINSPDGKLRDYIRNVSTQFENPCRAVWPFFCDFPEWGVSDSAFLRFAMETLSEDEKYAEKFKQWKKIIKKRERDCVVWQIV